MRKVLSLSISEEKTREIKKSSKKRGFSSVSSYVNYLFELDKDLISEEELLGSIKSAREDYKKGRALKVKSIADLV